MSALSGVPLYRSHGFGLTVSRAAAGMPDPRSTVQLVDDISPCLERTVLNQQEHDLLEGLPGGQHEINAELSCEFQAGHPGLHHALCQAYGSPERVRRLQWSAEGHPDWLDIAENDHCDAEGPPLYEDIDENEVCLLPTS